MSNFICKCESCKREVDVSDDKLESVFLDDDENENGEHLWLIYWDCPYCEHKDNYEEIWD